MQDYSRLQYLILKQMFSCRMTILGDRAQTMADEKQDSLTFLPKIFGKDIRRIVMNKSYRNTVEISSYANALTGVDDVELFDRHGKPVTEQNFAGMLEQNLDRDIRQKTTTTGPHRDDLSFMVNNIDIRKFGSQGQQRTAALSLKLSEIELVKRRTGDTPVLLLDDVLSELDGRRQNYLLNSIENIQTLITCTGLDEFINHRFAVNRIYKVIGGTVTVEN